MRLHRQPLRCLSLTALAGLLLVAAGCELPADFGPGDGDDVIERTYTFEDSAEGWTGGFVDFSTVMDSSQFDFVVERRPLPESAPRDGVAFYVAGTNVSDDLFMYLKHPIDDLAPNTTYEITISVDLFSNVPSECAGIGGSPGGSVWVKVGASNVEPTAVIADGDVRLNVDKGGQSEGGEAARVVGDVATDIPGCPDDTDYRLLERANDEQPLEAATGEDGSLWIFTGTDSGFEGRTALYYDTVRVTLRPRD